MERSVMREGRPRNAALRASFQATRPPLLRGTHGSSGTYNRGYLFFYCYFSRSMPRSHANLFGHPRPLSRPCAGPFPPPKTPPLVGGKGRGAGRSRLKAGTSTFADYSATTSSPALSQTGFEAGRWKKASSACAASGDVLVAGIAES